MHRTCCCLTHIYRVCAVRIAAHKAFREFYFSLDACVYLCLHVCVCVCFVVYFCVFRIFLIHFYLFHISFILFLFFLGNFRNQLKAKLAAYSAKNSKFEETLLIYSGFQCENKLQHN